MKSSKQREIFILMLCLLIGFALRFYTLDQKSLWMDEIYTFNDSRDGLKNQLKYYQENPIYPHPPLFFVLTHFFYPFDKPERDLRIIPLVFGTLSILMMYFLSGTFSPHIALPCTISLTFMTYHISLSQDARSYSLLLFLSISGLYFFMKHLQTSKKKYLIIVALFFSASFYTSYSSLPLIALSQILWFYRPNEEKRAARPILFLTLVSFTLLLCLPWIIFVICSYKGQSLVEYLRYAKDINSLWSTAYWILHDWATNAPLMVFSVVVIILFPFLSKNRKNVIVLLSILLLPIAGVYLSCKVLNISHFLTSRYFIGFLPFFFILVYLSLNTIEIRFKIFKRFLRLSLLFVILFISSNLFLFPLYYRSEKQDFRGLANYLKANIQDGDKIILLTVEYFPGILHYFGVYPNGRHYRIPYRKLSDNEIEYKLPLLIEGRKFTISSSKTYWLQYASEGNRLWFVLNRTAAKKEKDNPYCVLKGYFDGSFLNLNRFPINASMYLFLWPKSSEVKGIDMQVE